MSASKNRYKRPLIIDIGSNTFRMGWASEDFPDIIAPTVYVNLTDYLFTSDVIDGLEDIYLEGKDQIHLVGDTALKYQNILRIHEFMKEKNYILLSKFFLHYYYILIDRLKIPEEYFFKQPIIFLTPFYMSELEKSKLQEIFFETFHFPSLLFLSESQAILSTLQKTSGVIVDLGESHTSISSIFHGFTNVMARDLFPIVGKDLTDHILSLILSKIGSGNSIYIDSMIAKEIKEKLSLCIINCEEEKKRIKEGLTKYDRLIDLPDGSNLKINQERFLVSEPLFDPNIIHVDHFSLAEAVSRVIKSWERENWKELVSNIILSGGGSLIHGLGKRLQKELQNYFSDKLKNEIKVVAASGREHLSWIGASILYTKEQLSKGWIENLESNSEKSDLIKKKEHTENYDR
jgi:actin-related protein